ncbi:MAG: ABC transporter permease [Bacillota bacterium]|jgi:osmoprotectant transport system permease protein|nr:ABC transporter permease [Clostridia bacterium]
MMQYILNNQQQFWELVRQHVELTGAAVILSIVVAIPLGIIATRFAVMEKPVLALANLGQAIPSLVILGISIPLLGIGFAPSLFALFLRAVLPILLNTYVGIKGVDYAMIEAAKGMGMKDYQILFRVEIPLTVPVILAGIRTATVQAVSLATLAAFIGGGGLGDLIQQGIMMVDSSLLLAGAIPTAVLALMADYLIGIIQRLATPKGLRISI